jgi:hypothetical protein
MIHLHWGNHKGGTRNYRAGEYDTCEYFTLIVYIPIYVSFQGCFHVIDRPKTRRERLRDFAQTFLDLRDLPRQIVLPLRPISNLKWMWFYYYLLWLFGIATLPGLVFALLNLFLNPLPGAADTAVSILFGVIGIVFAVLLILYLLLRRPSRKQARIRGLVASRLGPFSDPADWAEEMVVRVTPAFGIDIPTSEELIRKAEGLVQQGHYEDALVVARMALALLPSPFDHPLAERAKGITEDCLRLSDQADE